MAVPGGVGIVPRAPVRAPLALKAAVGQAVPAEAPAQAVAEIYSAIGANMGGLHDVVGETAAALEALRARVAPSS